MFIFELCIFLVGERMFSSELYFWWMFGLAGRGEEFTEAGAGQKLWLATGARKVMMTMIIIINVLVVMMFMIINIMIMLRMGMGIVIFSLT